MSRRAFSPTEEVEILQMRALGIPTRDILAAYGQHRKNALYALFARAGVPLRPNGPSGRLVSDRDQAAVLELWNQGLGLTAIARDVKRSNAMVRRTLEAAGIEVVRRSTARAASRRPRRRQANTDVRLQCAACGSSDLVAIPPGEQKPEGNDHGSTSR